MYAFLKDLKKNKPRDFPCIKSRDGLYFLLIDEKFTYYVYKYSRSRLYRNELPIKEKLHDSGELYINSVTGDLCVLIMGDISKVFIFDNKLSYQKCAQLTNNDESGPDSCILDAYFGIGAITLQLMLPWYYFPSTYLVFIYDEKYKLVDTIKFKYVKLKPNSAGETEYCSSIKVSNSEARLDIGGLKNLNISNGVYTHDISLAKYRRLFRD